MLHIAFCDDDTRFLKYIVPKTEKIFKQLKTDVLIHSFTNGMELVEQFRKYDPYYDVIFLDIEMPVINGKDVAQQLRILDKKFKLAFITAYESEALNTFQYDVIGFLTKTRLDEELSQLIERINRAIIEDNPQFQFFKVDSDRDEVMEIKVPLDDIVYFESINRKVYLHSQRGTFTLRHYQFSEIVNHYIPLGFIDIHRTCIVNMKYIFSVDDIEIRLDDNTRLPLSRRKKQQIFDKFSEIIR
ncbi:two component transcriptional regulator, LytTR family [Sporobacter termitidis DSM 10068]|uniref:Stage 0 sporulation protein A homolog n=1 Tax=Sporobacter termitidis DSM 10068 TaxID=1123282 RepID=A0A1M5W4N6_9FIRM|nr:LytTR family DNA-binding domain-containing protein [Sporobacter termitidis]SHH82411.1 two component transcriptional regulator, LytTR family [Sporobacter termitidis DSM 10068]